jgi:DHA1 family multidrug resistance protein-like MFS transporter
MRIRSGLKNEFSFVRGNMLVLIASWLLMNFAGAIPSTYYSLYILALGGTPFIIGIIQFVSFLALASVQFLGGYIADKYGRRWLIFTFTFGMAFSNLFYVFAPSWHFILVGVVLQNLFLVYQPALQAIISDSLPPERRGMGFSTLMFISNSASVFSPVVAGVLYVQYGLVTGMRMAYVGVVVFYLIAAVIRVKLTETLRNSSVAINIVDAVREYPKAAKEGLAVWKLLPRSMFFLFLTNALSSFAFSMANPYWMVYAKDVLGVKGVLWAIVMTWFSGSMIFAALPSGKLADKIGRKKPLLVSWVFLGLFPLLFLSGDLPLLFVGFLFVGISNVLFGAAYQALEADLVPRELRGKEVGCSQFIMYVLMAVGGLVGGFEYQFVSPLLPFILASAINVPCAAITLSLIHEAQNRER